jgi:hypothetical protein
MARGRNDANRARRLIALALLALTVAIPAGLVAGTAGAGWEAATTRSRASGVVRITSNRIGGLHPGARRTLTLTLHNPDSKRRVVVRRVRVRDVGTTKRRCAASLRNLRIRQPRFQTFTVRPGGTRKVRALLTMPNTVADACQGAVFKLRYRAETSHPRPSR